MRQRTGKSSRLATLLGLTRAFIIAYGIPGWKFRLTRLYRPFVTPGMLCFDIGAHFGNRIPVWRTLGATIIAIEPQPLLYKFLVKTYSKGENTVLLQAVVSKTEGVATLYHNTRNPSLSTINQQWIDEKKSDPLWGKYIWDEEIQVAAYTLDQLIERYGAPDFCKIDVEGAELMVLSGLTRPLACISFEYLTIDKERTLKCIGRLEELGIYEYNWTYSEFSRLKSEKWMNSAEMKMVLNSLSDGTYSGDIYARLVKKRETKT